MKKMKRKTCPEKEKNNFTLFFEVFADGSSDEFRWVDVNIDSAWCGDLLRQRDVSENTGQYLITTRA